MSRDFLPRQDIALVDGADRTTTPFYVFLQSLERYVISSGNTDTALAALISQIATLLGSTDGTVAGIPHTGFLPDSVFVQGQGSIRVFGTLAGGGVFITLDGDNPRAGPTWYYGTGPDGTRGLFRLFDAIDTPADGIAKTDSGYTVLGEVSTPADLPGSGNTGEAWRVIDSSPGLYAWDGAAFTLDEAATGVVGIVPADDLAAVEALSATGFAVRTGADTWALRTIDLAPGELEGSNLDGVAGNPSLGLADVTPAAGGTLRKVEFDAKGRRSQEDGATTDDLPEGATNLYFTNGRAQAAVVAPTIVDVDTTHAPSGDAVFDALAGKEVAGAAAAALVAANDFTTDEILALNLAGEIFTPTLTNITNAAVSTVGGSWYYVRVKDVVVMGGQLNVLPSALGTIVEVQASLPVASAFTNFSHASGSGSSSNGTNLGVVGINASGANDTVRILFSPFAVSTHNLFVQIIYRII